MIPLNYNQLYYFYQIAETGSIVLASKKVLISSPALSMQLKELEETLGTPLFLRVGKKLVLTEAGKIVHEYAKDIFKLGHELKDSLADRGQAAERPKIEIGCQDTIPKNIAENLVAFLIQEKSCKVVLKEGTREKLLELQRNFKLDLILTNSVPDGEDSTVFEAKLLGREELIIVGTPKFKNLKTKFPQSLSNVPMIVPTYESSSRAKIDQYLFNKSISVDVIAEVEDKASEIDLALRGFGVIAVTKSSVAQYLQDKTLIEIGKFQNTQDDIWMLVGKRKILNPLALFAFKNFSISHH